MSHRGCAASSKRKLARNGDGGSDGRVLDESLANRKLSADQAVKSCQAEKPDRLVPVRTCPVTALIGT